VNDTLEEAVRWQHLWQRRAMSNFRALGEEQRAHAETRALLLAAEQEIETLKACLRTLVRVTGCTVPAEAER
jgi:hypothetical protein